jgi:hypothetical protein
MARRLRWTIAPDQPKDQFNEHPHTTETNRCLTDAELDVVSGGEGNLANACIHAATQWMEANTKKTGHFGWDLRAELCP